MKIGNQRILCLAIMIMLVFSGCSEQGMKIDSNHDGIPTEDTIIEDTIIEEKTAVDDISSTFKENGYTVKCENVEQQILTGNRYLLTLSGASDVRITLYEYDNSTQSQADIACIDESGSKIVLANGTGAETTYIEWKSVPHFYQLNNMIIQYVGTDESILDLLMNLCGDQFAGGDTE